MRPAPLLLVLVACMPSAAAIELAFEDARADVIGRNLQPLEYPSADILWYSAIESGDRLVVRVGVAERPYAPDDSILVRNWFRDSANRTVGVVHLEVRGGAANESDRFHPLLRLDDPNNATLIEDATWHIDGASWVFTFPLALVATADCLDPSVFTQHVPPREVSLPEGADKAIGGPVRCRPFEEQPPRPARAEEASLAYAGPFATTPTGPRPPADDAPGTRAPTPLPALVPLAALVLASALALGARRR